MKRKSLQEPECLGNGGAHMALNGNVSQVKVSEKTERVLKIKGGRNG